MKAYIDGCGRGGGGVVCGFPEWPIIRSRRSLMRTNRHDQGRCFQVDWVNPHIFIYVDVKDANGKGTTKKTWLFPNSGCRRVSAGAGDQDVLMSKQEVTVTANPAKTDASLRVHDEVELSGRARVQHVPGGRGIQVCGRRGIGGQHGLANHRMLTRAAMAAAVLIVP